MAKRVLIVDDSNTMRKIITRSLRQAGLDCGDILEAGDGAEALELLGREAIDLVLSDINMPNMDGMEFLRVKAGRDELRRIPVVMITTEAGADILAETKALGAVGSIKKPFTPEQIRETLGSWF